MKVLNIKKQKQANGHKDRSTYNTYRYIAIFSASNLLVIIIWIAIFNLRIGNVKFDNKPIDSSNIIQIFIAIITVVIGVAAALLAFNSLKAAQRAEEGELYLRMMERYASKDMLAALRTLGKFTTENKHNLKHAIVQWKIDHNQKKNYALELEDARHKIKYFYRDLMQMNQANYLSDKLTKRILNAGGRYLFNDVVLEMEPQSNPLQFDGEFGNFRKFYVELKREQKLSLSKPVKKVCLIPARYNATRYPGKLLSILIDGVNQKTVIRATYERIQSFRIFDFVAVVTNSIEIKNEIQFHGGNVIFNQTEHNSGSDRIAEAVESLDTDIVVNVQGDEPFVEKKSIEDLLKPIENFLKEKNPYEDDKIVTSLMRPMDNEEHINSSDFVKVICDKDNYALYFSRSIIPYQKNLTPRAVFYEHIGVYAFTKNALLKFSNLSPTPLEQIESIECLRYLENNIPIKMVETEFLILEIDTEADRMHANKLLQEGKLSFG